VTWHRSVVADALVQALKANDDGTTNIFPSPPMTLNPPAIAVGRPTEVRYGVAGFGVDQVELPVICIGPMEGDDMVDGLIAFVRTVVMGNATLDHVVQTCQAESQRNWRALRIGGADYLAADVVLAIEQ
jgi:hypothetical protein